MNIELRHLRYFVAVAEELHFGRAAARLNISQPPLSQQIQILEQQVGARLLARTNRSVSLTAAGKQFLADSRQILSMVVLYRDHLHGEIDIKEIIRLVKFVLILAIASIPVAMPAVCTCNWSLLAMRPAATSSTSPSMVRGPPSLSTCTPTPSSDSSQLPIPMMTCFSFMLIAYRL